MIKNELKKKLLNSDNIYKTIMYEIPCHTFKIQELLYYLERDILPTEVKEKYLALECYQQDENPDDFIKKVKNICSFLKIEIHDCADCYNRMYSLCPEECYYKRCKSLPKYNKENL